MQKEVSKGKLLYYSKMNFGKVENLAFKNKIHAQARAFDNLGLETDVFHIENKSYFLENPTNKLEFTHSSRLLFLLGIYNGFISKIDIQKYDFLYIRHFQLNPLFLWTLFKIKKTNPSLKIFMELPTYPYNFKNIKQSIVEKINFEIDQFCTKFLKFFISKIVTFSQLDCIYSIQTIQTDNGIDLANTKLNPIPFFDNSTLNIVGLANLQTWHGYDRIINGLSDYHKTNPNTQVFFHIIGTGKTEKELKNLSNSLKMSEKVLFYGHKSGQELDSLLSNMHLAVSSCGMHRISLEAGQSTTLKSREYTARGIPFVVAYKDYGFVDFPYTLNFLANESPIEINTCIDFYQKVSLIDNYNTKMRNYAQENFTWENKLQAVVNQFLVNV